MPASTRSVRSWSALLGAALLALAPACSSQNSRSASGEAPGDPTPAARVGDEVVTLGELDTWIKEDLFRRQTQSGEPAKLYEVRRDALENLITQRLVEAEAERRDMSAEELLGSEAEARSQVDEAAVEQFYESNRDRISADFETVAPQIRQHLERQARNEAVGSYVAELREQKEVEVLLEAPRLEVAAEGPARGPEQAPVTIVEFSDYQCPFCRRAEPVVEQVLERYPEQVRLVYRHFPLDSIHPRARAAAEAAVCAEEQGHFWPYHEQLFANQDALEDDALAGYAEQAGLDMEAFRSCLSEPETRERVETDLAAGRALGVTGTPAFFVNGIPLRGARPLDDFVDVIERELESGEPAAAGRAAEQG